MDFIDLQVKEDSYRYIMHFVEYLTKCHFVQPLKSKTASEVSHELLQIFLDTLQSGNGREFTAQIMQELSPMWLQLVLVNGHP